MGRGGDWHLREPSVNPAGANGLLAGTPGQVAVQFVSVPATTAYTVVLKLVAAAIGLRAHEEDEVMGPRPFATRQAGVKPVMRVRVTFTA